MCSFKKIEKLRNMYKEKFQKTLNFGNCTDKCLRKVLKTVKIFFEKTGDSEMFTNFFSENSYFEKKVRQNFQKTLYFEKCTSNLFQNTQYF